MFVISILSEIGSTEILLLSLTLPLFLRNNLTLIILSPSFLLFLPLSTGLKGFFRGLPPTLVGIIPARATYFWAYSTSKHALTPSLGDSTLTHILSGIAAVRFWERGKESRKEHMHFPRPYPYFRYERFHSPHFPPLLST